MMSRSIAGVAADQRAALGLGGSSLSQVGFAPKQQHCRCGAEVTSTSFEAISRALVQQRQLTASSFKGRSSAAVTHASSFFSGKTLVTVRRSPGLTTVGGATRRAGGVQFVVQAKAYDAGRSDAFHGTPADVSLVREDQEEAARAAGQKVKIGIYFATWWGLNVVFNIYNKKVLNIFPYPWLTSTLSLAAGSLIMLVSWATRIVEVPDVDPDFLKALAPVRFLLPVPPPAADCCLLPVHFFCFRSSFLD